MLIAWGIVSILIGILIFIVPRVLNYVVAIWFIITGIALIIGAVSMPRVPGFPF
jgi:uncharacterized membrane protein HdeD (DUF308 family)